MSSAGKSIQHYIKVYIALINIAYIADDLAGQTGFNSCQQSRKKVFPSGQIVPLPIPFFFFLSRQQNSNLSLL